MPYTRNRILICPIFWRQISISQVRSPCYNRIFTLTIRPPVNLIPICTFYLVPSQLHITTFFGLRFQSRRCRKRWQVTLVNLKFVRRPYLRAVIPQIICRLIQKGKGLWLIKTCFRRKHKTPHPGLSLPLSRGIL